MKVIEKIRDKGIRQSLTRGAQVARERFDQVRFPVARDVHEHWTREGLDPHIEAYMQQLNAERLDAVEISGDFHAARGWRSYRSLNWPDFDICAPLTHTDRYDVAIAEQVLEHVPDPWGAVRNMAGLLRPGGRIVVTTPFLIRLHPMPGDFWRFTEDGLRVLLEGAGLEVEGTGSWGNARAVRANFSVEWPRRRWYHPMTNEPHLPLMTWAFGRLR